MSVIKEMSSQVAKCNKMQQENKNVYKTLTAELKRYKEQVIFFKERQKFDLTDREKYIDDQLRQVIVDRNAKKHDALFVPDTEETLDLAEETMQLGIEHLPAGSITTWEDLTTRFLAQFFPSGRTVKLCNDILMFQQHHGESLSEA
ncbi:zinc finger, CCHC-type containing protein [Tanacetum coccineum]